MDESITTTNKQMLMVPEERLKEMVKSLKDSAMKALQSNAITGPGQQLCEGVLKAIEEYEQNSGSNNKSR